MLTVADSLWFCEEGKSNPVQVFGRDRYALKIEYDER